MLLDICPLRTRSWVVVNFITINDDAFCAPTHISIVQAQGDGCAIAQPFDPHAKKEKEIREREGLDGYKMAQSAPAVILHSGRP